MANGRTPVDPSRVRVEFDAASDGEPALLIEEEYPADVDARPVARFYSTLLGDDAEAEIEEDGGHVVVRASTSEMARPAAMALAASVSTALVSRAGGDAELAEFAAVLGDNSGPGVY